VFDLTLRVAAVVQIVQAVRHSLPVIIISGSGRLADAVTKAVLAKRNSNEGEWDEYSVEDEGVREIVSNGDVSATRWHEGGSFSDLTLLPRSCTCTTLRPLSVLSPSCS